MPDWPRKDLVAITVTVTCNITPGCSQATPCETCRALLEGTGT